MNDKPRPSYRTHILLFLATVLTTTAQGAASVHKDGAMWPLWHGWVYSVPLLAILLSHEFGHYIAARIHKVPASLPYFIPLPPPIGLLGTMGAVITQEASTDRKKLIDIGAAGPLAGLLVAIPVLWIGLKLSPVAASSGGGMQEGNSLLYALLKRAVTGEWLPGHGRDVQLHPTAFAGWAGLLVTMLNLIPIGQLDGGHVATAYFGNDYRRVAGVLHRGLPFLAALVFMVVAWGVRQDLAALPREAVGWTPFRIALLASLPWVVWAALLRLMKRISGGQYHPPVDATPLP
ncbi:MAG TPA: site-2 protease family protein, partial [Polyangia bacterium]|nr:site-2 protease family protein [Polyangia bacterium]